MLVLADVIYYYRGVITAQVSAPPLVFYSGKSFTYSPCPPSPPPPSPPPPKSPPPPGSPSPPSPPSPPPPTCTYNLNSLVPGYANFTALPTGFTATIQLTNASYAYFYHALGLVVNTLGWLYVTNVTIISGNEIIETLTIKVQNAYTNQTVCSFTVISDGQPITSPTQACSLSPGPYFISVLVQPNAPLYTGQSETVTLYFGYNVVKGVTVPLPPISG
ncbi:MAG: hypothetical protein RXO23_04880 [Vulcanisaeta sp.]